MRNLKFGPQKCSMTTFKLRTTVLCYVYHSTTLNSPFLRGQCSRNILVFSEPVTALARILRWNKSASSLPLSLFAWISFFWLNYRWNKTYIIFRFCNSTPKQKTSDYERQLPASRMHLYANFQGHACIDKGKKTFPKGRRMTFVAVKRMFCVWWSLFVALPHRSFS